MCGRYTLTVDPAELQDLFGLSEPPPLDLLPSANIAPGQFVAAIPNGEIRRIELFKWGLIPAWAKDPKLGQRMFNARAETLTEKPAFRAAFRARRCLIPADGFYEWQTEGRTKTPFLFQLVDGRPLAFAGLWETWRAPDEAVVKTCTIITTAANALVAQSHPRMPVILPPTAWELWLASGALPAEAAQTLLQPFPAEQMKVTPAAPGG